MLSVPEIYKRFGKKQIYLQVNTLAFFDQKKTKNKPTQAFLWNTVFLVFEENKNFFVGFGGVCVDMFVWLAFTLLMFRLNLP